MAQDITKGRLSNSFAYASLTCVLLFWIAFGLNSLPPYVQSKIPAWYWVLKQPGWVWPIVEGFALLLAIVATALRSKLRPIALPVAALMFLLTMYIMGS